jgi:hypothetical protein
METTLFPPAPPGVAGAAGAAGPSLLFGDGSDGDLLFDGFNNVVLAAHGVTIVPAGREYTLTSVVMANNMTVSPGVHIICRFPVFVKGTLTNSGTMRSNGDDGIAGVAGGAGGTAFSSPYFGDSGTGGNGMQAAGGLGGGKTNSCACNDAGTTLNSGAGGNGNGVAGGAAQTATAPTADSGGAGFKKIVDKLMGRYYNATLLANFGAGGSGGGGDNTAVKGGGGGAGGGILAIAARIITGAGTMYAKGGNGGDGDPGGVGPTGGGGGGTGGELLVYTTSVNPGTMAYANGGSGGLGRFGGTNGATGDNGTVRWIQIV